MKIKINKKALLQAVTVMAPVTAGKKTPLGDGVLVEASEGILSFKGATGELSIRHILNTTEENGYECLSSGAVCVSAELLINSVKTVSDGVITISNGDNQVVMQSGKNRMKLNVLRERDFPKIEFIAPESSIVMKQMELKDIIEKTTFATSDKQTRPILMGVNFCLESGTLTCIATDSYRLSKVESLLPFEKDISVTIPNKVLNIVKGLMLNDDEGEVKMDFTPRAVAFHVGETTVQTTLYDGKYPDVNRLIPTEFAYKLTGDKKYLLDLFGRADFIKTDGLSLLKMELSKEGCVVSKKDNETGEFREELEGVEYEGEPLCITALGKYLKEAVKAIPSEKVEISFVEKMKPFILKGVDDNSVLELVLPVRTYN